MSVITLATSGGANTAVDQATLDALSRAIAGEVLTASSPGYDTSRTIWNAMIDRKPGIIVRCTCTADVSQAVRFARSHGLLLAVKGGGHNIAGNAVCEGGLMIDLSAMKSVKVDPTAKTAEVEPGVTLGEFDAATQEYGLATPVGINSTTGIAGLTLGGGFGWISRKYGLTIDNLTSAEVVLADGSVVTASASENPDLFWGIRGGGGNFGVVTLFRYALHNVGPEVLSGLIVHPFGDARNLLRFYRDFTATLPDDVTVWVVMRKAPPLPFLPEEWHGKEIFAFAALCAGDMKVGEEALRPLREFGNPIADVIGPHPFVGFQQAFDPLLTPGMRNYWKSNDFLEFSDGLIDAAITAVSNLPSPHTEVFFGQMGGATSRIAPEATAYQGRSAQFVMNVHGRWETAGEDETCIRWCRNLFNATTPYATGDVYVNFLTSDESDRIKSAYGDSYGRLVDLKKKYDPSNLFRMNQNINPA